MQPAVFLDRDDTLAWCDDLPPPPSPGKRGDTIDPALLQLIPGSLDACLALQKAGYLLILVTNQGSVARGAATLEVVEAVQARLRELLTPTGASKSVLHASYYCPFHPEGAVPRFNQEHPWRKPGGGMVEAAAAELGIDLSRSWLVGDKERDREAGIAAGLAPSRCIRVVRGTIMPDVGTAARLILAAPAAG